MDLVGELKAISTANGLSRQASRITMLRVFAPETEPSTTASGMVSKSISRSDFSRASETADQFPAPADFDLRYSLYDAWTGWYSALANVIVDASGRTPGAGSPSMMEVITDLNMALIPIWQIEIPIIASQGAAGSFCQGTAPGSSGTKPIPDDEDPVDPDLNWEIVGFVKMNFYDTDIGIDPPKLPDKYFDGTAFPANLPGKSHPFSFNRRCDLVRGKVDGRVKTFRAGPLEGKRHTLLVD